MNLIERHMVSACCDTCHEQYAGEWPLSLFDSVMEGTRRLIAEGWTITPERFQCAHCTEDNKPPLPQATTYQQRWKPYHGWSPACQDCGTDRVELDDLDGKRPVWECRSTAATILQDEAGWTHTDRTRCPDCTDKHMCSQSGHQWVMVRRRMDVNLGARQCARCSEDQLVALAAT